MTLRLLPVFLTLLCLTAPGPAGAATAPVTRAPFAWMVKGTSLVSPTGQPLFERLAGWPVSGWLKGLGSDEMNRSFEGYHEKFTLGDGSVMAIVRTGTMVAGYVVRGERCVGHAVYEPMRLPDAEGAARSLTRYGFSRRIGMMASKSGDTGVDAEFYERRAAGYVERYTFCHVRPLPGDLRPEPTFLVSESYMPTALVGAANAIAGEGAAAIAGYFRLPIPAEERRTSP